MTIEELGTLAELLAAVATLATLGYLALQIRQSNRSNQLSAVARIGEATESWLRQITEDRTLQDVYMRGLTDPASLDRAERMRFNFFVVQLLRGLENGWLQLQWGTIEGDYWTGYREVIRRVGATELGRECFERNRAILTESFVAEVDDILARMPTSGT